MQSLGLRVAKDRVSLRGFVVDPPGVPQEKSGVQVCSESWLLSHAQQKSNPVVSVAWDYCALMSLSSTHVLRIFP